MKQAAIRSLENAIVLFLISLISALLVDYNEHGYPPSPGVVYYALLTAFLTFLTTMGTQRYKTKKAKKEAEALAKKADDQLVEIITDDDRSNKLEGDRPPPPPTNDEGGHNSTKGEEWLIGCVI